jgi:ribose 5-phosphate isomerase B
MESDLDLRAIARRAVARVMGQLSSVGDAPARGVHAATTAVAAGKDDRLVKSPRTVAPLVCAADVSEVEPGGSLELPGGARVTPLAREEAFRRGVQLVSEGWRPAGTRVAVGCDHGGRALKQDVLDSLRELGVTAVDLGTHGEGPCDYPDFAAAVAREVAMGAVDLGVVIDGVGIGSAMAANRIGGVLAANCWDERTARSAREHNHANVLTLGAGHLDRGAAHRILATFLSTAVGPERHARRVAKIRALGGSAVPEARR